MADPAIKAALEAAKEAAVACDRVTDMPHVAISTFLREMASAGVSLAHMHEWHDLAAAVRKAAEAQVANESGLTRG
jgi:hypothetical protein